MNIAANQVRGLFGADGTVYRQFILIYSKNAVRLVEIENTVFDSCTDGNVQKRLELTEHFLLSLEENIEQL